MIKQNFANLSNADLIETMQQKYEQDPDALTGDWAFFFEGIKFGSDADKAAPHLTKDTDLKDLNQKAVSLIEAYRRFGHVLADFNPIATERPKNIPELDIANFSLSTEDLQKPVKGQHFFANKEVPLKELIGALQETYCQKVGIEYMHMQDPQIEAFLQERIESNRCSINLSIEQKKMILEHLNRSELFENFLHTKYVGQKRFSLEGGETLIPIMAAFLEEGPDLGLEEIYIGMAHRGRLNILSNILNKKHSEIFSEFEDSYIPGSVEGGGDVKYHKGYASSYENKKGKKLAITLTANPSHLEAVNPVILGQVRARQIQLKDERLQDKVMPVLIHGDAAIAGQGIVYETMQLYKLPGYSTGGTIHVVINNQIGFTTLPKDSRSTRYCTDVAKAFGAPVFHVNAEDPDSCIFAANLALEIRQRFLTDVFIEINCYRKYGHNESDEPAFTQPIEYQLIRKKQPIREIYRDKLISQGVLEKQMALDLEGAFKKDLQNCLSETKESPKSKPIIPKQEGDENRFKEESLYKSVNTKVDKTRLRVLTSKLAEVPKGFTLHKKIEKLVKDRENMISAKEDENSIDWGLGEHLAFATLLDEGIHVRLSGQDSRRGTFSHRHAMWMDQKNASKFFPLNHINPNSGRFDVFNSPLSEYGVLGFEYGYSLVAKKNLVIWEAQFGDFFNGAQIIVDQFISTGEHKWGTASSLVMLLPHGYEGQGPEHSSARIERFLQLCGAANMQVVIPSTPAQLFHLLRRQILGDFHKPLIVFTPKSLLRHKLCMSSINDLSEGNFETIIDDKRAKADAKTMLLCSGKMFYNLVETYQNKNAPEFALVRVEQFYPFDHTALQKLIASYKQLKNILWVQDEPRNMGAWEFLSPKITKLLPSGVNLHYIGREASASPAVGSFSLHNREYEQLVQQIDRLLKD